MAVYLSPGVFPNEIDLSVLPASAGPLLPAFIGTANKGPLNTAVFVANSSQALNIFGDPFPESYLMYAVLAFFEEGTACYVMRVGVQCQPGQPEALDHICIDISGNRGQGWGRIPLFTGIDFGRINLRAITSETPYNFHAASDASAIVPEYSDANIGTAPTDATMTVAGIYTGNVDDSFIMVITGPPTGVDPIDGCTFQLIRNSDGITLVQGTLQTSQSIDLGNGLTVTIAVTQGHLDTNDTFSFSAQADNLSFTVVVDGDPTTYTMTDGTTCVDFDSFKTAFTAATPGATDFDMVEFTQSDGTVVPQLRTSVEGHRIQLGALDNNNLPDKTVAFANTVGVQMFAWDIPRSYLLGLDSGPYTITTANNRVVLDVIGQTKTDTVNFNLPIGLNQTAQSLATAINSAGTVAGQKYFEAFTLVSTDGSTHVVIATPLSGVGLDRSLDTLYLVATYSNLKTLRFAEEFEIPFPYTRSYRGYSDSRLLMPNSGQLDANNPLSCEIDPNSAQCTADRAYFQNIVGWLVGTSAGTWLNGYTVTLTIANNIAGDSSGRYNLAVYNSVGQLVSQVQDINFDARSPRYISNVVNPGSPIGGTNGDTFVNYEARPAYLNNDPSSIDVANPYVVRLPSPFHSRPFTGMADGIPLDPVYSSALDAAVIGTQAEGTGIFAFENPEAININILCIPGFSSGSVIGQALQMCERRGDVLFLVDPPFGLRPQQVVDWHNGMLLSDLSTSINSSYGALYWGWIQTFDQFSRINIWVPPSGHIAAVYSRTARVAQQWSAPAGLRRGRLLTALDVEYSPSQPERDLLYSAGNAVNPIVKFPQEGIVVWGQRTLQRSSSALDRVNVRMLLIYMKQILIPMMRQFIFEPNDRIVWKQVLAAVNPVIGNIQANRGITGYNVVCDQTNNTPDRINNHELWISVFFIPTFTIEFVVLNLVTLQTGASFSAEQVLAAGGITVTS